MTINEIISDEKFSCFKLSGAEYDQTTDTTTITFLYSKKNKPTDELKDELKNKILTSFDLGKCSVKFKPSYADQDIVFKDLLDFEKKQFPYLKSIIKKEDLKVENQDDQILITIDCDNEVKDILEQQKYCDAFSNFLSKQFFEPVKVVLNPCKAPAIKKEQEEVSDAVELLQIFEKEATLNTVEVSEMAVVVGKSITSPIKFIKDIKKNEEIVVAGKMLAKNIKAFIPKNQKGQENPTEKHKFSFVLEDASGSIDVVMFPSDADLEKLDRLIEGCEVVVSGSFSEFGNAYNIRANNLSVCKILTKEVQYLWRDEHSSYKKVFPKEMVDLHQMDLFSALEAPKEYWQDGKSVVVFDFETTGLNADTCEIIEIGAVKVKNGVCVETFSTLINPKQKLSQEITNITGITNEMLVFAPSLEDVIADFYKFTKGSVLSAYNIGFDIKFLKNAGLKYRYNFNNEQIDTLELARNKIASLSNYKLSTVVKALNISLVDAHRALNDAIATAKVFIKLI